MIGRIGAGSARPWRLALMVFALALGVRLVHLSAVRASVLGSVWIGDGAGYVAWAERIAAGDWLGRGVFYQAPLYPYLIGALLALGRSVADLLVLQALLGAAGCTLIADAARRWFGPIAGWVAGGSLAVYAPAVFFDGIVQKTSVAGFLLALVLWLLVVADDGSATAASASTAGWRWLWVGLAAGALVLVRENALAMSLALVGWLVWEAVRVRGGAGRVRSAGGLKARLLPLIVGHGLVLLPVAVRNLAVGGGLHLTTSQLGPNFYIGNHPGATGTYVPVVPRRGSWEYERDDARSLAEAAAGRQLTPREVSGYWLGQARRFIADEPVTWLRLEARKLRLLIHKAELPDTEDLYSYARISPLLAFLTVLAHWGVLLPLGVAGAGLAVLAAGLGGARDWPRRLGSLAVLAGSYAASVVLFYVTARYRMPMVPFLALGAGAGAQALWTLVSLLRPAMTTARLVGIVAVVLLATLANWPPVDPSGYRAVTSFNVGAALQRGGRGTEAEAAYRAALQLRPDYPDALSNLALVRADAGDLDQATALLARAVQLDPQFADAHNNLGLMYAARGDLESAVEHYREAIALTPQVPSRLYNLATALAHGGEHAEAIALLERVVTLDPGFAEAHNNLGILQVQAGQRDAGMQSFRNALAAKPGYADAGRNLARAIREGQ